ncbi:MAG TPA: sulfotransferase [Gaiellaceae bacterium]|nr:sulfotransferase [Gaiellaceae bacterium]
MKTTRLWGVRRRIWRVRRSVPRIARPASRVLRSSPPEQPVIVLGCPRSGTTALLQALLRSPELRSVQSEGHILWDEFHRPSRRGWNSDALAADDVTERERAYVYTAIRLWTRGSRFVDKTPESCLRVGYLDELFPDARFVFLRRRAADTVSSLMEGWRARPRFVKYRLPAELSGLGELSGDSWSFVLVPGWRELLAAPLEEVCAHQYVACNEAVLDARASIAPARWTDVSYEDLVRSPVEELERTYGELGLHFTDEARRHAEGLGGVTTSTALTAPQAGKWREQNPDAVARIEPLVADVERRLGYGTA